MNATASAASQRHRSIARVVLGAPRPVWILIIGAFINRAGSFFANFATLFLTHRGLHPEVLPLALAGVGAATIAGSLAGGWLCDRIGQRTTLVASMSASAICMVFLAFAPTLPLVVLAVCLAGLFTQSYLPAASALLIEHTEAENYVPIFAFFRLALNMGAAVGPLLAGLLAAHSYTLLFCVDGGTSAICGLVILAGIRSPRGELMARADEAPPPAPAPARPDQAGTDEKTAEGAPGVKDGEASAALRSARISSTLLCVVMFVVAMIYVQYRATVPLEVIGRGFSTVFYGALLTLNGTLVIVAELPISSRTRNLPWPLVLSVGIVTMTLGLTICGLASSEAVIVIAFAVFTVGEMIFAPVTNATMAVLSPPGLTARYQGRLTSAQTLGWALGPPVGTTILRLTSVGLWTGMLVLALICGAAIYLIWKVWS